MTRDHSRELRAAHELERALTARQARERSARAADNERHRLRCLPVLCGTMTEIDEDFEPGAIL